MHFGQKLIQDKHEPWSQYYLDYASLKTLLKEDLDSVADYVESGGDPAHHDYHQSPLSRQNPSMGSFSNLSMSQWSSIGLPKFVHVLNDEVERILFFFLQEQAKVAAALEACRYDQSILQKQDSSLWMTLTIDDLRANQEEEFFNEKLCDVALHLLRLIQFVDLNMTGIRKILKKHDKHLHTSLSAIYLGRRSTILQPLLSNHSIDALCKILEASVREWSSFCLERQKYVAGMATQERRITAPPTLQLGNGNGKIEDEHNSETVRLGPASSKQLKDVISVHNAFQSQSATEQDAKDYGYGSEKLSNAKTVILQIRAARYRLQETGDFVKMLAATEMIGESFPGSERDEEERVADDEEDEQHQRAAAMSNILNLFSTFLYMTNYYIVAPASNTYAEKLGGDASMAGIIIGMTPVAALVSTLLYSWWTSYSYKSALIFASICSVLGNILYGAGLPLNNLNLVLFGRLLNGFGSARSINRRYIADSFSRCERTAASAAFVTAGAMGMAVGPAVAAILEFMVDDDSNSLFWQVENAPGWIMLIAWSIYLAFLIVFFRDPPKRTKPKPAIKDSKQGEEKPLLADGNGTVASKSSTTIQEYNMIPVIVIFTVYFVLKLILESILSSSPMITAYFFQWTGKISGAFLAILGLLLLPANWMVGRLSTSYEDRELVFFLQVAMLVGCVAVLNIYSEGYSVIQYIVAAVVIFVSTNALEGPNMSLLSKTIPRSWSDGFFNVGLLATEAGTLGRAIGDVLLTACGASGMELLLNRIFGIMAALSVMCLGLSYRYYHLLAAAEKDD